MKKAYLIIPVVIVVIAFFIFELHSYKKPYQLILSDNKTIVSDGAGPYAIPDAVDFHVASEGGIIIDMRYSPRHIIVKQNTRWKDDSLLDTYPRIFPTSYHIQFSDLHYSGLNFNDINIGDHVELDSIAISLIDADDTNMYLWAIVRSNVSNTSSFYYVPLELYEEGHAELLRQSQDEWALDVDGWFKAIPSQTQYPPTIFYYVKLNFVMTIVYKSII